MPDGGFEEFWYLLCNLGLTLGLTDGWVVFSNEEKKNFHRTIVGMASNVASIAILTHYNVIATVFHAELSLFHKNPQKTTVSRQLKIII